MTEIKKEMFYYLTMFTIEGHKTFRANMAQYQDAFTKYAKVNKMKVTGRRDYKIDKITGEVIEIK